MLGPDAVYPLLHHVALQLCDRPLLLVHAVEVHLGQLLLQKSKKRMEAEERQDEAEPVLGGRLALCTFLCKVKDASLKLRQQQNCLKTAWMM